MLGMSLYNRFKSLDVYRKLPSDFVQPTYSGAMLSIISSVIMIFLFLSEFSSYTEVKLGSEMSVDVDKTGDKLRINMDLEMLRLPCSILSLDLQDVMGSHSVNIEGDLMKYKIDKQRKIISGHEYTTMKKQVHHGDHSHDETEQPDFETVKQELIREEGCKLKGFILVNKVPGNFHISSHAYAGTINRLAAEGSLVNYNLAHIVNHVSFGKADDLEYVKKNFGAGELAPLDGTNKISKAPMIYEYYMKVI